MVSPRAAAMLETIEAELRRKNLQLMERFDIFVGPVDVPALKLEGYPLHQRSPVFGVFLSVPATTSVASFVRP